MKSFTKYPFLVQLIYPESYSLKTPFHTNSLAGLVSLLYFVLSAVVLLIFVSYKTLEDWYEVVEFRIKITGLNDFQQIPDESGNTNLRYKERAKWLLELVV